MLGKKTGVLFTISSVNFELKQGKEYRSLQYPEFSVSEPVLGEGRGREREREARERRDDESERDVLM